MTLIGGEDGIAPSKVKLYVKVTNPDFDLLEGKPTHQIDTIENPYETLIYNLPKFKFGIIWSLTLIVPSCLDPDHSKIYYIRFRGIATKKKHKVPISVKYELRNTNKISDIGEDRNASELKDM